MPVNMSSCKLYSCSRCDNVSFCLPGETLPKTGLCRPCRMGWSTQEKKKSPSKKNGQRNGQNGRAHRKHTGGNPYEVRPGQTWESLDPRDQGRTIEVLEVDESLGKAKVLSQGTRTRSIKLSNFTRLKGRGYRKVR